MLQSQYPSARPRAYAGKDDKMTDQPETAVEYWRRLEGKAHEAANIIAQERDALREINKELVEILRWIVAMDARIERGTNWKTAMAQARDALEKAR